MIIRLSSRLKQGVDRHTSSLEVYKSATFHSAYLNLDGVRHGGNYLSADFPDRVDNGKPDDVNGHHDA